MGYDGSLKFDTKIDSKGFESDIRGFSSKIGTLVKGVAAGYTGKTLVEYFIGSNAEMEQYLTSFEVMLGDAETAKNLMNDLRSMAAVTPFETTDLANASKTLMSFGVELKDVQTDLQMLGDISQGNGEKFKSLALVFGQIKSAGKLMGQDLLSLVNVGFNPLQTIAKQTGKSMADLKKDMEDGKISFEMVAEAMKSATSEGGLFYQSMEKQSKTMTGMLSTLKDNLAQFGRDAGEKAFEQVKDSLQGLIDMIDKASKDGTLDDIAEDVGNALNALVSVLIKAAKFIYEYKNALIAGAAAMATFKAGMAIGGVITAAITAYRTLKIAIDAGTVSQLAMNGAMAANPIGLVIGAIGALVAVVATLAMTYDDGTKSAKEYRKEMEQISENEKQSLETSEGEILSVQRKADRYEELRKKINLTTAEKLELKTIAKELQEIMPNGINLIDEETGAYNSLKGSIDNVIASMRAKALLESKEPGYKKALAKNEDIEKDYKKKQQAIDDFDNKVAESQKIVEDFDKAIEKGNFDYADQDTRTAYGKAKSFLQTYLTEYNAIYEENQKLIEDYETAYKDYFESKSNENSGSTSILQTTADYYREQGEAQLELSKQSFEDLEKDLESRRTRGLISDTQYYSQKDALLKKYGKSQLKDYDSFYGSIKSSQDSANKEYLDNEKKTADETAKAWQDSFEDIVKNSEDKTKDIENQQNALAEKLSSAELFSRETVGEDDNVLILTNFQEKFQELEKYQQLLDEIRSKGAGEGFADQIKDMGVTDAVDFMETLLKSDDIDGYLKGMEQYNAKANEIAQNEFADENQAIKDEFANEVVNTLGEIPAQAAEAGTATAEAFAEALVNSDAIKKIQSTLGIQDINSFLSAVSSIKSKAAGEIATGSAVSRQAAASVPIYAETGKSNNAGIIEIHTTVELDRNKLGESVTKWQTERGYQSGKRVN